MIQPFLERHEREHSGVGKLVECLESERAKAREKNDGDLSEADTAKLRGKIKFITELLAAIDPKPMTGNVSGTKPNV